MALEGLDVIYIFLRHVVYLFLWHKDVPGVTPRTYVMFGEGTHVDLVLGMGPQALRMPPAYRDKRPHD
jgi:hypothetical protein